MASLARDENRVPVVGGVTDDANLTPTAFKVDSSTGRLKVSAVITSGAITSLNGLTAATQTFATGTSGSDFNISSVTSTHTFNIPDASGSARGLVTTGAQAFGGTKTFVAPVLGAAVATSINGVTILSSTATLDLASGKTFKLDNTLEFAGTDSSIMQFGTGGTVAYVANKLSVFAATTSAELASVISDETGSGGALVFANSPTLTAPALGNATATSLNITPGSDVNGLIITGTNITTAANWTVATRNVSGNILNVSYGASTTLSGGLVGQNMDLSTNVTTAVAGQNVIGYGISLPVMSTTSNNAAVMGVNVGTAGAITNGTAGSIVWRGFNVVMPVITQSAGGTVVASAFRVFFPASGAIVTNGQMNGLDIVAPAVSGPVAGTLNGINIRALTSAGAATENAMLVGTGWDAVLKYNTTTIIDGTGNWTGPAVAVAYGGTAVTSASITAFNNITGYTAAGATGTTSTNIVFSTSPTITTPTVSGTLTAQGLIDASGASAGQIQFPATQNASADANTLDDYEEGTWTVTGNNVTYTGTNGTYVKIGQMVMASFQFTMPATADGNTAQIKGLPYTVANYADDWQGGYFTYITYSAAGLTILAGRNSTLANIYSVSGSAVTNVTLTTQSFRGVIMYRASA